MDVNWKYLGDAVPAFLTIVLMPFTYSIAYGVIGGLMAYISINGTIWAIEKISRGRLRPSTLDDKEYWTYKVPGGLLPPWLVRLCKGKKHFWRREEEDALPQHYPAEPVTTQTEETVYGKEVAQESVDSGPAGSTELPELSGEKKN